MAEGDIRGTGAVLINPDGRVVASATDFDQGKPGGFSVYEAQRSRVWTALANAAVVELSVPDFAACMRGYEAEQLVRRLCERMGYKVDYFDVAVPFTALTPKDKPTDA